MPLDGGVAKATYTLDKDVSTAVITVKDLQGNIVYSESAETTAGTHEFTWDGKDKDGNQLPDDAYVISVSTTVPSGETKANVTTTIFGKVTGVASDSNGVYIGLGDISVLVFFGWLSVMGSWYLQAHTLIPALILPATACGLLATAVLNINNLRDINSDRENGKNTLVVRLGEVNARRYHACLLMGSLVCLALFNLFSLHSLWGWLFLLAAPLLVKQARYVMREMDPVAMRPMLERTVKGALLTNLLFVLGIFLSQWAA